MKFTKLAAAAALALSFSAAQAASGDTTTFKVKIQITGTCIAGSFGTPATAISDIDFGSVPASNNTAAVDANNLLGATKMQVLCSKNLPVTIALAGTGNMTGTALAQTIPYSLHQPTGPASAFVVGDSTTTVWGAGASALTFNGLGLDAATQTIVVPVAASIPAGGLNVAADSYEDTVTATLTY